MSNTHEYRTLNTNFKIKTNNQLKSKDLNTIISQESLLSNRKQVDALKSNLQANRLGSFESVLSQTLLAQVSFLLLDIIKFSVWECVLFSQINPYRVYIEVQVIYRLYIPL